MGGNKGCTRQMENRICMCVLSSGLCVVEVSGVGDGMRSLFTPSTFLKFFVSLFFLFFCWDSANTALTYTHRETHENEYKYYAALCTSYLFLNVCVAWLNRDVAAAQKVSTTKKVLKI